VPGDANDVPHCAEPELNVTAEQPLIVVPFEVNPTVPVGESPATVAVNVTDCPMDDGFWFEATEVVLVAVFTVWPPLSVPVLVRLLLSPE
jgi:hypothetical protein